MMSFPGYSLVVHQLWWSFVFSHKHEVRASVSTYEGMVRHLCLYCLLYSAKIHYYIYIYYFIHYLASWPNWATDGEGLWLEWWPRTWWSLVELHERVCRWEKPTEGQTSLQHSTCLGFILVWPNSILPSVKTHGNTLGIKAQKGSSDSEKQDYLVWWTSIPSMMFGGKQLCSSPAEYHTARVAYTQLRECPWVAQPQPELEFKQIFLEKHENENVCLPHPTWLSLRGEEMRRRMADSCQMLMSDACPIIP